MLDFVIIIDIWTNTDRNHFDIYLSLTNTHLLEHLEEPQLYSWLTYKLKIVLKLLLLMLLECVIPEIMQGIQIRRMYCIRQSCKKSQAYHSQRWPEEICATKILLNAWLWRSNFGNTVSHSAPAKPLSNLKSDFV